MDVTTSERPTRENTMLGRPFPESVTIENTLPESCHNGEHHDEESVAESSTMETTMSESPTREDTMQARPLLRVS